jgi:hypothetical protein
LRIILLRLGCICFVCFRLQRPGPVFRLHFPFGLGDPAPFLDRPDQSVFLPGQGCTIIGKLLSLPSM